MTQRLPDQSLFSLTLKAVERFLGQTGTAFFTDCEICESHTLVSGTRELQSICTLATLAKFKARSCKSQSLTLGLQDANPSTAVCESWATSLVTYGLQNKMLSNGTYVLQSEHPSDRRGRSGLALRIPLLWLHLRGKMCLP